MRGYRFSKERTRPAATRIVPATLVTTLVRLRIVDLPRSSGIFGKELGELTSTKQ